MSGFNHKNCNWNFITQAHQPNIKTHNYKYQNNYLHDIPLWVVDSKTIDKKLPEGNQRSI